MRIFIVVTGLAIAIAACGTNESSEYAANVQAASPTEAADEQVEFEYKRVREDSADRMLGATEASPSQPDNTTVNSVRTKPQKPRP